MKFHIIALLGAMIVASASGCYPGSVTTSEVDTVVTVYEDQFNFSSFTTFHMPDSILQIGEGEDLSDKFDQEILDRTRQNLLALGYVEEPNAENADVYVFLEKTASNLIIVAPPPCYWCWYPGYPGYPPYYPWYPPGYVYNYPIGTLFANMYVPDEVNNEADAVWGYRINGLITGSDQFVRDRLDRAIDQAFEQSPYLGR